ncbi:hypothetical protein FHW96_000257 [Novosphingobium sp. SG751A]|uniref:hypothetical protein n=1 Tax=Novosphingobium sp. SG751A TaxID=2587000 RepID=UPI001551A3FE|nr:hypothetical protein [Novosphingobium sp. SG751A]NOW44130.1 hypothetical protein [Novosphingobium sp. SG751A]
MATQLVTTEQPKAPAKVAVSSGGKLAAFVPQTMEEAWRLSGALAASGMTPKAYGNDQNKIMVGIMAGAEVGLTPFAALQSIAVIGNNPSLWGDGALALVQASGLLEDMEEFDDGNVATCRLVRKGRTTPIVRTFSQEDAKKAGLSGKSGPWSQYPQRMRQMRARAWAMRDGFSDVLKGLHIAEEARDYQSMAGAASVEVQSPLTGAMLIEQAKGETIEAQPANDGALGEDSPAAADSRTDEPQGDQHDDADEAPAYAGWLETTFERIEAAAKPADLRAVEADMDRNKEALPNDVWGGLTDAVAAKRAALLK